MMGVLQDVLVREKKWFTEEEFVDMIAICQSLPGIIAINMATYVGYKKRGFLGSLVSTIAIVLPAWIVIIIICKSMAVLGDNSYLEGALAGFRAAAVGLIVTALYKLGKTIIKGKWALLAAAAAFAMIVFLNIGTAWIIVIFMLLGLMSAIVAQRRLKESGALADSELTHSTEDISSKREDGGEEK